MELINWENILEIYLSFDHLDFDSFNPSKLNTTLLTELFFQGPIRRWPTVELPPVFRSATLGINNSMY